jgi:hypothetical protein
MKSAFNSVLRNNTFQRFAKALVVGVSSLCALTEVGAQTRPNIYDCEVGSVITAVTPSAGKARIGSVYSTSLYDPTITSGNTTYNPKKIQVRVTKNGVAKANCSVVWLPRNGTASGWVFPDAAVSDANGYLSAWWVAGTSQAQNVDVSIQQTDGIIKAAAISGTAYGHDTRSDSMHVYWNTPAWDQFKAEVTPQTWATTTYYEVIGFNDGYTGIQSTQTLFSLWAVNGVNPQIIDPGISTCSSFGGEGTGMKCEAPITPKTNVTYRFEVVTALVGGGQQDYTVYFTDTSNNVRKKLGTMRIPAVLNQAGADGFVEDWSASANSCLNNVVRSAKYGNVAYLDHATQQWVNVTTGKGSAVITPDHNEVCVNYKFDFNNGVFSLTNGGMNVGYPLNLPNGPTNFPNAFDPAPVVPMATALLSGTAVSVPSLSADTSKLYMITVPAGKTSLTIKTSGGTGDADIYVKQSVAPTISSYLQASEGATTVENITVNAPVAGTYYVLVNASAVTISGVSLVATYQ